MRRLLLLSCVLAACEASNLTLPEPPAAPGPGTLYGRVVFAVPGRMERIAAADAQVLVLGTSLETKADAEGRFLLSGVVQQDGVLLVRHDADADGRFERQRIVELSGLGMGPGRQIALGELSIGENATVSGIVKRGDHRWESGGHAGSTVFVPAGPFTAHTNDDGSFVLPELPAGSLRFTVFRAGYVPQTFDGIELRAGEEFRVRDVVLQPETGEPAPGAIDGRVTLVPVDAVAGTTVAAIDTTGTTRGGEVQGDGTFRIGGLMPQLYDVVVARPGYSTAVVPNVLVRSAESVLLPATVLIAGTSTGCLEGKECSVPTTCRLGRTDCASGAPVCVEKENSPNGTPCGQSLVCLDGACVECNAGATCTPDNACHVGIISCENGREQCNDTGVPQPNGATCGDGSVCRAGTCGPCNAGATCTPSNGCHEGTIACTTGEPVCADTLTPKADGTQCGDELVCSSGVCLPCVAGASCTFAANRCHKGRVACGTGRPVCEDAEVNADDGTTCGDGLVCDDGACRACASGSACSPADPCHRGALACGTGEPVCVDLGTSAPNGTPCGDGAVCNAGACLPCAEGTTCVPDASCHVGRVSCVTGEASCVDLLSNRPDGAQCGELAACVSGACLPCNEGATCTTQAHPCHAGAVSCSAGVPSCEDTGENLTNGTACGSNLVCNLGECRACASGAACAPENPCHVGAVACGSGEPVCTDTGSLAADGTSCGDDLVCKGGACVACDEGASCAPDGEACHVGRVSCATGSAVCVDTLENRPNGSSCGDGMVCGAGTCASCTTGADCSPTTSLCHVGAVACETGAPVCDDTGALRADGTGCGDGKVCFTGSCVACTSGASCTPTDVCHVGVSSCTTGRPTCNDTGANKPNGSPCGSGKVCSAGLCKPSGFSLSSGDEQSIPVAQLGAPVVVLLLDGAGQPLEGVDVTIASPPGATTIPATVKTTSLGRVTFYPRMPRQPGVVRFTLSAPGKGELVVTATATKPATGQVYPIVNVDHVSGNERNTLPGSVARVGVVSDVVEASDGTLYIADWTNHTVRKLTPEGVLSVVAGNGQSGSTGDGAAATAAKLYNPSALALDESRGQLFIAEFYGNRVRRVVLSTGIITTLAGNGATGSAPYGDLGPASTANLANPTSLAIGPDGLLYIADAAHDRVRTVDLETEVINTFLAGVYPGACATAAVSFMGCGVYVAGNTGLGGCSITWDSTGDAYVSGQLTGLQPAGGCGSTPGIVRVAKSTGALSHVAGKTSMGSASGRPATEFTFPNIPAIAIDGQDNLLVAERESHVLRRIEARTGRITNFGGTGSAGYGGDLGPVGSAVFSWPRRVRADRAGNLLVADGDNVSVRVVSNGLPTTSGATLSIASGNGQSAIVNQVVPSVLSVRLTDGEGLPLVGYLVQWKSLDAGGVAQLTQTRTDVNGVASTSVRVGRNPGAYRFEASFLDVAGRHAAGSPATMTSTALAPPNSTIFPLIGVERIEGDTPLPGAGSVARVGQLMGIAVASDGSVYVADRTAHRVRKLSPDGGLTNVAGNGTRGANGDGGLATQAQLDTPTSLLLDEARKRLYVTEHLTPGRIRVVNLDTGSIAHFAGMNASNTAPYGDGLPATAARLDRPSNLARGPDGALYVADQEHDRIRRIDPDTGVITTWLQPTGNCYTGDAIAFHGCGFNISYNVGYGGCSVVWDGAGNAYISGIVSGQSLGTCNQSPGIVRRAPDGSLTHVAGRYGGTTLDRMAARDTLLAGPPQMMFDSVGNLLLTTWEGHTLHRLEAATGRLALVSGGPQGFAGDWAPFPDARFKFPFMAAKDAQGHLYVSDSSNLQLRQVWKGALGVAGAATLSVARGQGQSVRVGQFPPTSFGAKLVDGAGQPLVGHVVTWTVVDPGGHLYASAVATDVSGTSFVLPRAGLKPGNYRFRASYSDLAGQPVSGSPLEFSLTATAPPLGTIFSAVNADRTQGNTGVNGASTIARIDDPRGVVAASDGTVYFADGGNNQVKRLSPAGLLTLVAGTGEQNFSGDGGLAKSARLAQPAGVALDEAGGRLFVADSNNHRVRWIDLASGAIYTLAGGGTAGGPDWGDGGPATNATFDRPGLMSFGPDGMLYVGDGFHRRLRRIDPDGRITTVLPKPGVPTSCSMAGAGATPLVYATPDPYYAAAYGSVAWDDAVPPNMYVSGLLSGTLIGSCSQYYGVVKLAGGPDGAMTHVAGFNTGTMTNGADPKAVRLIAAPVVAFVDGELHMLFSETNDLWKISSAGTLVRIAGSGSAGFSGDMTPATGAVLNRPYGLTALPGGGLLFSDQANEVIRIIW